MNSNGADETINWVDLDSFLVEFGKESWWKMIRLVAFVALVECKLELTADTLLFSCFVLITGTWVGVGELKDEEEEDSSSSFESDSCLDLEWPEQGSTWEINFDPTAARFEGYQNH